MHRKSEVAIGAGSKRATWKVLDAAYGDLARAYHRWRHISALDELAALATRPGLITTAIFWRVVVYRTRGAGQADEQISLMFGTALKCFKVICL